jgi:hypothetical protein
MAIPVFHTTYPSNSPPAIHSTVERLGTWPSYPEIYTGSPGPHPRFSVHRRVSGAAGVPENLG